MENLDIELRNISTGVQCPDCGKKFITRLSVDYLSQHQNEQIQCICVSCYKTRIVRIK
jgi:predicted RNA-binding Zn-ribbon protein involved in translation (DUF1610 family)